MEANVLTATLNTVQLGRIQIQSTLSNFRYGKPFIPDYALEMLNLVLFKYPIITP
jgi:hypothetical protein